MSEGKFYCKIFKQKLAPKVNLADRRYIFGGIDAYACDNSPKASV